MRIPSNKVADIFRFAHAELCGLYAKEEIESFMFIFFEHYLGWNKAKVLSAKEENINQSDLLKFNFGIKDVKKGKPIQYVTGKTCFYGLDFLVNEYTLIPRPETEELISLIINENAEKENLSILDIGTGSGCIAISLAKHLKTSEATGIDISQKALEIATKNKERQEVDISFLKMDILNPDKSFDRKFDVIVSNPPYVCNSEKSLMERNVLDYEPHTALFVEDSEPLIFYDKIADFAKAHLTQEGTLYFEINERFGMEMNLLLDKKGFKSSIIQDINGKNRICKAFLEF